MSFPADATVSEAGEFPLIARLRDVFAQGRQVLVGPGDDAAVLRIRNGHVVVSTDLLVEGPIQYDAAVDATVAKAKMPDSKVAGRATVLIFPDLNTGNNTYKAVQRSAGAIAIGPVLQGLNKPVNDLSRGALVEDIVNTVAITAIQAQSL